MVSYFNQFFANPFTKEDASVKVAVFVGSLQIDARRCSS